MISTHVRVERPEGTVIASAFPVVIENAADREEIQFDGAGPVDVFWLSTVQVVGMVTLRRRDVLFDEVNLDSETGALAKYRIVGPVETFESDHQECVIQRVVGA